MNHFEYLNEHFNLDWDIQPEVLNWLKEDRHLSNNDIERLKRTFTNNYIKMYRRTYYEWEPYIIFGLDIKDNPMMGGGESKAYTRIVLPQFGHITTDLKKDGTRTEPYVYHDGVYDIACKKVVSQFKEPLCLKLDHKYRNRKTWDFCGTLVLFFAYDRYYWHDRNHPKKYYN